MEAIKIVHLKDGSHIICKITELTTDDNKPLCFLIEVPMILSYVNGETEEDLKVKYTQWSPFSKSLEFRIPFDQVVTVGEAKTAVLEKYVEIVQPFYPILDSPYPSVADNQNQQNEIEYD